MSVGNYSYSHRPTCRRLIWISFAKLLTLFIPDKLLRYVAGRRTHGKITLLFPHFQTLIQLIKIASCIAWREKIALFFLLIFSAAAFCFWLEYVSSLVCSPKKLFDYRSLFSNDSKLSAIHGSVVDWSDYSSEMADFVNQYPHQDLSLDFPKFMALSRPTSTTNYDDPVLNICIQDFNKTAQADAWLKYYLTIHPGYDYQNNTLLHCPMPGKPNITGAPCFSTMDGYKTKGGKKKKHFDIRKFLIVIPLTFFHKSGIL